MDLSATHDLPRRRLLTVTGVTGIAYTLSWIAGLAVAAPSPKLTASGAKIAAALAGHQAAVTAQFALTEGLPAAGLAIVSIALARAACRSGAAAAARAALIAGVVAAFISLLQFALGAVLAGTASPGPAHLLYYAVNRLDGVKMLALAIFSLAAAASGMLPRWLRYTGITLAIVITASGIAYLLLLQGLAILAIPAGVLLLLFITGTGITVGTTSTAVVTAASAGSTRAPARPGRRTRALAVLGAAAATLTVWAVAGPLAGVDLRVHLGTATQHVGPATVAIVSILAGLAAWGLLAALEHFTPRARTVWTAVALVTLALSLTGPLGIGVSTATKVTLTGMHLAAAAVLVPMLTARVPDDPHLA